MFLWVPVGAVMPCICRVGEVRSMRAKISRKIARFFQSNGST